MKEVHLVVSYIDKLCKGYGRAEGDVGVVCPYAQQCKLIKETCRQNGYTKINVGTAEEYQGQEKAVIIVSTVRSDQNSLGFVTDKRVNSFSFNNNLASLFHFFHFFISENERDAHTG